MTHEDAFLLDIVENRDDDTPRRIFADFLLDQTDPVLAARGEFIHAQVALARGGLEPERLRQLRQREQQLLEEFGPRWLAPLAEDLRLRFAGVTFDDRKPFPFTLPTWGGWVW